jgi:hypothetical protein
MDHEHYVGELSEFKFNGGNPVFLCAYEECQIIVAYAEKNPITGKWEAGEPFNEKTRSSTGHGGTDSLHGI